MFRKSRRPPTVNGVPLSKGLSGTPTEIIEGAWTQMAALRARLSAIEAGTSQEDILDLAEALGRFNDVLCRAILGEHRRELQRRKKEREHAAQELLRKARQYRARTRVVDQIKADLVPIFRSGPGGPKPDGT